MSKAPVQYLTKPGEYYDPTDSGPAVQEERRRFLAAVERVAPTLLDSLREDVVSAIDATKELEPEWLLWDDPCSDYLRALVRWQRRWRLWDSWCREAADRCARTHFGKVLLSKCLRPEAQADKLAMPDFVLPRISAWQPTLRTRKDYETAVHNMFGQRLREYLDGVEEIAKSRGLVKVSKKRPRHGEGANEHRHYEWLARFQVLGETQRTIARSAGVEDKAVAKACQDLARRIGLTTRGTGAEPVSLREAEERAESEIAEREHRKREEAEREHREREEAEREQAVREWERARLEAMQSGVPFNEPRPNPFPWDEDDLPF